MQYKTIHFFYVNTCNLFHACTHDAVSDGGGRCSKVDKPPTTYFPDVSREGAVSSIFPTGRVFFWSRGYSVNGCEAIPTPLNRSFGVPPHGTPPASYAAPFCGLESTA